MWAEVIIAGVLLLFVGVSLRLAIRKGRADAEIEKNIEQVKAWRKEHEVNQAIDSNRPVSAADAAVSYTHLTLPTNREV